MELWDILNKEGQPTGRTIERGKPLQPGEYHLVVHIWIRCLDGRFLIQQRADHLKLFPGIWATTGGSALAGENSMQAALRELQEELGVQAAPVELRKLTRIERSDNLLDVWLLTADIQPGDVCLQPEEVKAVDLVDKSTLVQMIKEGRFHDYGSEYLDLVLGV